MRLTCPRGHAWDEADAAPGAAVACPICGLAVAARVDPADTPTVLEEEPAHISESAASGDPVPVLPDFAILGEVGRGGMGIVYKAQWRPRDNRVVALKVIRKDRLTRDEAVRRFRREAHAASRLNHPNIVQVFDSDHTGDTHYLVMEYVDGLTLERYVEERGPLSIDVACDYIRQAA